MEAPFRAVLADMDGVITKTAVLHERAWKLVFDAYLEEHAPGSRPFSHEDYLQLVDGRPRYVGAEAFLTSRGIDSSEVRAVADRKNDLFHELLESDGVALFEDTLRALVRWRRSDLRVGIVTASRNGRTVLERADLPVAVDVVVDGRLGAELGLTRKADLMIEAAERLGVRREEIVLLEDAVTGVRAAREVGFGLVVGVGHDGHAQALEEEEAADRVVTDVRRLRFAREIPPLLEHRDDLCAWLSGRRLAVLLDYDGTLTPIVNDPAAATLSSEMREVLRALSGRYPVALLSGRDRADVEQRVGLDELIYAGSHGFDIRGPGLDMTLPEAEHLLGVLAAAEAEIREAVASIEGVVLERKRFSLATHYRMVAEPEQQRVISIVESVVRDGLRTKGGKMVVELQPDVPWDKGRATTWIRDAIAGDEDLAILYFGDDETDEDAFAALDMSGVGVYVGASVAPSRADYGVRDPGEVGRALKWLCTLA